MYKNQFDNEFSSNIIYNAYMFYGQCDYLIESYANKVALKLGAKEDIRKIYFDEYNYKECDNFLSQSSLFSDSNVLIIKTAKKIPKKELDLLISLCNANPDSFFILNCIGEIDFKTMAKSFSKKTNSCEVRLFNPSDKEALHILNDVIQKKNVQCGFGELQYLYTMHQKDLSLAVNDIDKLAILQKPITTNIINTQCFGMGAISLDEFLNKLFRGEGINKDLYMLLEEGMNEINLLNQTTSYLQQLFTINSYIKLNGQLNIKEIWGYNLPKNIANTRASIAIKFNNDDFIRMFNLFATLELDLKTRKGLDTNSYIHACFRNFSASLR